VPPALGTAGSHATSAAISYPHCSFKELRMRKREFIAGFGSAAAWPLVARAQQRAVPVVGFLNLGSARQNASYVAEFLQNLEKAGYVEGKNVAIEYRWGDGQSARLAELAADLVSRQVAVIVAVDTPSIRAAKAVSTTIPIVFLLVGDPVKNGLSPASIDPAAT
jgi:putative ABC transport system substrate-binding protein